MSSITDAESYIRERRKQDRMALKDLKGALLSDDDSAFDKALTDIDDRFLWRNAMRLLASSPRAGPKIQAKFARIWLNCGDHIRQEVRSTRWLGDALKVLLPVYTGPGLILYRGEGAWNRRRGTYGMSWTSSRDIADAFARGVWRTHQGGSVLLQTDAPPEAILYAPALDGDHYDEQEYIVESRRLSRVVVLCRYNQISPKGYLASQAVGL